MIKPFKNCTPQKISTPFTDMHPAIDWFDSYGTALCAPEDVKVDGITGEEFTPNSYDPLRRGYGIKMTGLETGIKYLYWHTQPVFPVSIGEVVKGGQIIAFMGNSGNVLAGNFYVPVEDRCHPPFLGTHLHAEFWLNEVRFNPLPLMTEEPDYSIMEQLTAISKTLLKIVGLLK